MLPTPDRQAADTFSASNRQRSTRPKAPNAADHARIMHEEAATRAAPQRRPPPGLENFIKLFIQTHPTLASLATRQDRRHDAPRDADATSDLPLTVLPYTKETDPSLLLFRDHRSTLKPEAQFSTRHRQLTCRGGGPTVPRPGSVTSSDCHPSPSNFPSSGPHNGHTFSSCEVRQTSIEAIVQTSIRNLLARNSNARSTSVGGSGTGSGLRGRPGPPRLPLANRPSFVRRSGALFFDARRF